MPIDIAIYDDELEEIARGLVRMMNKDQHDDRSDWMPSEIIPALEQWLPMAFRALITEQLVREPAHAVRDDAYTGAKWLSKSAPYRFDDALPGGSREAPYFKWTPSDDEPTIIGEKDGGAAGMIPIYEENQG